MRSGRRPLLVLSVASLLAGVVVPARGADPTRHVAGAIVEVDVDAGRLTLLGPDENRLVIEVPDDAVIVLDGEEGAILEDLYPGDRVEDAEVRVLETGRLLLLRARVSSPPGTASMV